MKRNSGLLFLVKSTLLRLVIKAYIQGALIHRASANALFSVCRWGINSPIDIVAIPLIGWMDESLGEGRFSSTLLPWRKSEK